MLNNEKYDYILIWGHGLKYKDEIIELIANRKDFEIIKILFHQPTKIENLVKAIYSFDYAPFEHLKAKTKYLLNTTNNVLFIFLKNNNPEVDYFGTGAFRHPESTTLKILKEEIRNKYNPYLNGIRTEDHIIHASDNESQTHYILKYLGYSSGVKSILSNSTLIKAPYHLGKIKQFHLRMIDIESIYCTILHGDIYSLKKKYVKISETPHFKTLQNKSDDYQKYLNEFQGYYLTDYYSQNKFINLENTFKYLESPFTNNYIIVKIIENKFIIQDGVHRACILKKRNIKKIIVAIT